MGIPSYYKKLCSTIRGLKSMSANDAVEWFFMDFNCLIYHCLHRKDTPNYNDFTDTQDTKDKWESLFIECIITYCRNVIRQVAPKKGVYIAIDGVVPMAKMRQQRLRRFKSVWLKEHEKGEKADEWDTNAITPGTYFMTKLRMRLECMVAEHPTWLFSSSDEPGEGEHKIIAEWRKGIYSGNFAIYGLDADLIVLSMLGRECCGFQNKIWLFREEVTGGKIAYDETGNEIFEWFSIHALLEWLCTKQEYPSQFILNYCFAMSILGNDFLPSSLGYKIRDDGHDVLISQIQTLTAQGITLIHPVTHEVIIDAVYILFQMLSKDEPSRILHFINKKKSQAYMYAANTTNTVNPDIVLGDNNWPLLHIEENILLDVYHVKRLNSSWKEKYITAFFPGFIYHTSSIQQICTEYLYGIQWVWAYYTGKDICFNWFYPFNLPPLWEWIQNTFMPSFPGTIQVRACDIRPVEQLALVLPLKSWSLIPPCPEKAMPRLAPQFYPTSFGFDSVGKRFFWECESIIPLPNIMELKMIIRGG